MLRQPKKLRKKQKRTTLNPNPNLRPLLLQLNQLEKKIPRPLNLVVLLIPALVTNLIKNKKNLLVMIPTLKLKKLKNQVANHLKKLSPLTINLRLPLKMVLQLKRKTMLHQLKKLQQNKIHLKKLLLLTVINLTKLM